MEDLSTVARPYAQAAVSHAQAEGSLSEWSDMLGFMANVVRDPTVAGVIANPRVDSARLTEILLALGGEQLNDGGRNFVKLLVTNDRVAALPQIHEQFERRRDELEGRRQVDIISAFEMDDAQRDALASAISQRLGREVDVTVSVDSALIG
ncbi:MAG: F0F1 ATP synthase subunit delta, partial [Pseudomonadota bacterium]